MKQGFSAMHKYGYFWGLLFSSKKGKTISFILKHHFQYLLKCDVDMLLYFQCHWELENSYLKKEHTIKADPQKNLRILQTE